MRLLFGVMMLLIISSVVIEASAGKSNQGTDKTKGNSKSIDSKEVRYSKNKSEFENKSNGKKEEVVREKQQRYDTKENQRINHNEFSKKNLNDRYDKTSSEEQRKQKSNKENKIVKNVDHLKNNKNSKIVKEEAKRHKRSLELEQSEESLGNAAANRNEDSKLGSLSKKEAKNKYEKKSGKFLDKSAKSDDILNTEEQDSNNQSSEDATSSCDYKDKSSSESMVAEKQGNNSKYADQQKQKYKKEVIQEKNVNIKKRDPRKKNVETSDELLESNDSINHSDELLENIETFNQNALQKSCSKSSKPECRLNYGETKNAKKLTPRSSNVKDKCRSTNQNIKIEKPMYVAGDNDRNNLALEIEQEAIKYEDSIDSKSTTEESEEQDCTTAKSIHDNAKTEFCSME